MLRAFLDASTVGQGGEKDTRHPFLAVAAWVGAIKQWSALQGKWRKARTRSGIDYLRMADIMNPENPQYRDWSDRKRAAVISRLIRLINKHVLFGVSVVLDLADYESLTRAEKDLTGRTPYFFGAAACIGAVARELTLRHIEEQVLYVFESGDQGEPALRTSLARFAGVSERFRSAFHVYSVMPGTKRQFPALDAADFLAWEITHHAYKADRTARPFLARTDLDERMKSLTVPTRGFFLDHQNFQEWVGTPEQEALLLEELDIRRAGRQRKRKRES